MRYVLPWSSARAVRPVSWDWSVDWQPCAVLSAALAGRTGSDRGGHIPIPTVTGGSYDDESSCLEKPEISARDPVQAVPHYMSEAEAVFASAFFIFYGRRTYRDTGAAVK